MHLTAVLALILACGGDDEPVEGACTTDDACAADEICWEGACEMALDKSWDISVLEGVAGKVDPYQRPWDEDDGTPPDLYVELWQQWSPGHCLTDTAWDTYEPVWNFRCNMVLKPGDQLWIEVWDEEAIGEDSPIWTWDWDGTEEMTELVRQRNDYLEIGDDAGNLSLTLYITPAF